MIKRINSALRKIRYQFILWLAGTDTIVLNARLVDGTLFIDRDGLVVSSEFKRTTKKSLGLS